MLVNPAMVAEVAPSATDVVPYCTVVFVKATVIAAEPLKLVPLNPVPMVKALVVVPTAVPFDAAVIRPLNQR